MRGSRILCRSNTTKIKTKPLDQQIQHLDRAIVKKTIRESLVGIRDNNWLSSHTHSLTRLKTVSSRFKSIQSSKKDGNSLYNEKFFGDMINKLTFKLSSQVSKHELIYSNSNGFMDSELYAKNKKHSLGFFHDQLCDSLNKFTKPTEVQILHLLIPTPQSLPNTIYAMMNPTEQSTKVIDNFFNNISSSKLESIDDRAYFLYEKGFESSSKITQDQFVPTQELKVDITNPAEWYPEARNIKRTLILHIGPTNSGKTFNALKRLKETNNGFFAGPLRLLAREVYDRFKHDNMACNLITGEEIIHDLDEFGNKASLNCGTIEMIDLKTNFDVAVIDEIQMIGDENRGWAWTNALLGIKAKEVHLCGEESAVDLIHELAKLTGDKVVVNSYDRLGKLHIEDHHIRQGLNGLKKGDCIVAFSKRDILNFKADIESSTKFKCSVVYGALPAETRSSEAYKFNTGKTDILVASDAIGMGLNLNIDRIIFSTHKKFDGKKNTQLEAPQVRQIAGRAGRFKVAPSGSASSASKKHGSKSEGKKASVGYVTAFDAGTLAYVREMMDSKLKMLKRAFFWPSDEIWSSYMSEFPNDIKFETILKAFQLEVKSSKILKVTPVNDRVKLVEIFAKFNELLIGDKLRMSVAPINVKIPGAVELVNEITKTVANSQSKIPIQYDCLNFESVLHKRPIGIASVDAKLLGNLEILHKFLLVWLWMNNRYPTLFVDRESAIDLKNIIEDRIETILETSDTDKSQKPVLEKRDKYMNVLTN